MLKFTPALQVGRCSLETLDEHHGDNQWKALISIA